MINGDYTDVDFVNVKENGSGIDVHLIYHLKTPEDIAFWFINAKANMLGIGGDNDVEISSAIKELLNLGE